MTIEHKGAHYFAMKGGVILAMDFSRMAVIKQALANWNE